MSVKVKWSGLTELTAVLENATDKVQRQAESVIKNHTEIVKSKAWGKAPVDTGFLKSVISSEYGGMEGRVISQAHYSGYLEFGTRFMSARPFMRPALEEQQPDFEKDLNDVMKGVFV